MGGSHVRHSPVTAFGTPSVIRVCVRTRRRRQHYPSQTRHISRFPPPEHPSITPRASGSSGTAALGRPAPAPQTLAKPDLCRLSQALHRRPIAPRRATITRTSLLTSTSAQMCVQMPSVANELLRKRAGRGGARMRWPWPQKGGGGTVV
eukprot:scaffold9124_cov101-Isochrysis_galbana.AAC.4